MYLSEMICAFSKGGNHAAVSSGEDSDSTNPWNLQEWAEGACIARPCTETTLNIQKRSSVSGSKLQGHLSHHGVRLMVLDRSSGVFDPAQAAAQARSHVRHDQTCLLYALDSVTFTARCPSGVAV